MKPPLRLLAILLLSVSVAICTEVGAEEDLFDWTNLPDLPDSVGLSGPFVGTSNDTLIVAGGVSLPDSTPESRGKLWRQQIYVLEEGAGSWKTGFQLEHPLAYGAGVSSKDSFILIGGRDADRHYRTVYRLRWRNGKIEQSSLPDLPKTCALTNAALLGDTIYVAGGRETPSADQAMKNFWALDLSMPSPQWEVLEPWPGPARISPVTAAQDGAVYLFGGAELLVGEQGQPARRVLTDAYRYRPGEGWDAVAGLPRAAVAAPGLSVGQSHVLVFGGDDGTSFERRDEPETKPGGFRQDVLAYHTITDTWATVGTLPAGLASTTAVHWRDLIVIPGGEVALGRSFAGVGAGRLRPSVSGFGAWDYACLGAYLLSLVGMGIYFSRREKTTEDFFVAGRRIPWWAAGVSIVGTQTSAISFMAIPAKVYATDWVYLWNPLAAGLIAPLVVFVYLPFFRRLNLTTVYEYLEKRFHVAVRLFASTAFVLFHLGRMAIVLFLPAIALSTVTGIDVYACIVVMGVLCTLYTVLGGIEAVIWTDFLQVIVLIGGAFISLVIIAANVEGGFSGIVSVGMADSKFHAVNWTWDMTTTAIWVMVIGNIFVNLVPYTSDQAVVQRYFTTKDEKQAAKAIWANAALIIPESILWFGLGTALYVFYKSQPALVSPAVPTDTIFPFFIAQQLPAGVTGLVIAALFAAAMSTVDSSLNSVATVVVTDFYRRFKRNVSDHACLTLARRLTAALGLLATVSAILMATYQIESLWDLFQKLIGLLGGSMAGLFLLGIFTRRANAPGALIGAVVGTVVLYLVQSYTQVHFFLYAAVGIVTCSIVGYLASLAFPPDQRSLEGLTIFTRRGRASSTAVT